MFMLISIMIIMLFMMMTIVMRMIIVMMIMIITGDITGGHIGKLTGDSPLPDHLLRPLCLSH